MKSLVIACTLLSLSLIAFSNQGSKKVALVKMVRGDANMTDPSGTKVKIKKGLWLKEGSIVETEDKSFVRLGFIDKSSMNIGPKSKLKIEKFSKKEAGVINVLSGKIRSEVSKNYLNMKKDKSKLFIKSKNAVMGIRGTDFLFSTNPKTNATTAVLFEGSVVFKKLNKGENGTDLESLVNKGRRINPGQFSVADSKKKRSTIPAKMSSRQFSKLMKNADFKVLEKVVQKKIKSIVPPGLTGSLVQSESETVNEKVQSFAPDTVKKEIDKKVFEESKGFVKGLDIKPADGSVVHVDSGVIIPPGSDAVFDNANQEWVSSSNGTIASTGDYLPPEGFEITDDGTMLKETEDGKKLEVVIDIKPVDEMKPIEEMETVKVLDQDSTKKEGPSPASTKDGEGDLERTPTPEGDGYTPPSQLNPTYDQRPNTAPVGRSNVFGTINEN